jgi:RuvA, C-terminal domain
MKEVLKSYSDTIEVLKSLGYGLAEARDAVKQFDKSLKSAPTDEKVMAALKFFWQLVIHKAIPGHAYIMIQLLAIGLN